MRHIPALYFAVLCYRCCSLMKELVKRSIWRFVYAGLFALAAIIAGYLLRPYYTISKIYATPTWCLYSVAICIALFSILYWLTDVKKMDRWTAFFQPAASNPLAGIHSSGYHHVLTDLAGIVFHAGTFHEGIAGHSLVSLLCSAYYVFSYGIE